MATTKTSSVGLRLSREDTEVNKAKAVGCEMSLEQFELLPEDISLNVARFKFTIEEDRIYVTER